MSNTANVAVLLAGCGHIDGTEIHESTFTLLALDKHGAKFQCLAPNIAQNTVVNHSTSTIVVDGVTRNILEEANRISRAGQCIDLSKVDHKHYDALMIPGGAGVIKNFCRFDNNEEEVQPGVLSFINGFLEAGKPIGAICAAPILMATILKKLNKSAYITLGSGNDMVSIINKLNIRHQAVTSSREIVIDEELKLITTPAYMFDKARPKNVWTGIERCVIELLKRTNVSPKK